jgi:ATP-dependent Clp protease protease subunit
MNEILMKHTGKSLDQLENDTNRDNFMMASEAKEYGLIDHVLEKLPVKPAAE